MQVRMESLAYQEHRDTERKAIEDILVRLGYVEFRVFRAKEDTVGVGPATSRLHREDGTVLWTKNNKDNTIFVTNFKYHI